MVMPPARPAAPVGRELPLARLLDNREGALNGSSRICASRLELVLAAERGEIRLPDG